jgi:hypothetical protein
MAANCTRIVAPAELAPRPHAAVVLAKGGFKDRLGMCKIGCSSAITNWPVVMSVREVHLCSTASWREEA